MPVEQVHTFTCPAGLRLIGDTPALWIESPRTRRRVTIVNGWWNELPARLAARVVKAASTGCRLVTFTRDELAAVADLDRRIAERCRPLHGGWRHKPSRSFSGHRYLRRG
jgi:hypothetical protein